jgi:iron complex outermembrane recepter protein
MFEKRERVMPDDSTVQPENLALLGISGVRLHRYLLAAASCILMIAPALGQNAQAATNSQNSDNNNSNELQVVIVTAQKRSQSIEKTPIAMAALTQQQLTDAGVGSVVDLTSATPNVQIEQYPFTGSIYPEIRGIVSRDFTETADADVAIYIDGVPIQRSYGLGSAFYDLERVEVLRGPQGTLYGKDATAGNINIITAPPEQQFAAEADYGYGNYGDVSSHAMVNIPVDDTLAVRISTVFHQNNGYFNTEGTTARNYGATDEYGGRISALWQPTSNFKWRLTLDDFISNDTEGLAISTGANGQPLDGLPIYNRPVASSPEPYQNMKNFMVRSRMDWQVSRDLSLSYIAGAQIDSESYATAIPINFTLFDPATIGNSVDYATFGNTNQYQELDLSYDSSWIKNIIGGDFTDEHTTAVYNNNFVQSDFNLAFNEPDAYDSNWGVFDQATVNVTDSLRVTGGIRESSDYKTVGSRLEVICPLNYYYPGGAVPATCSSTPWGGHGSWSATTWKAGIDYNLTEEVMSYITASTGYKPGGINYAPETPVSQLYYRPEHVTSYEGGIKGRYLDGKATLNADFFYEDYKDIDVNYWDCAGTSCNTVTTNAAAAAIWGPELDGSLLITRSDRLEGFLNYLHATYTDYHNARDTLTGIFYNLDGKELPNAPEISARLQYSHDFLLPNGSKLTPMAAVYWQAVSYLREFNLPDDKVPAYSKTSLRLTYNSASDQWMIQAYVDNLEDNAVRIGWDAVFETYNSYYAPPRTFGLRATYRY